MGWTRPDSAPQGTLCRPIERGSVPASPPGGHRVLPDRTQTHRLHVAVASSLTLPVVTRRCCLVTRPEAPGTTLLAAGQNYTLMSACLHDTRENSSARKCVSPTKISV